MFSRYYNIGIFLLYVMQLMFLPTTSTATSTAGQSSSKHRLLTKQAEVYLFENPRKAIHYAAIALEGAKQKPDTAVLTTGYATIARAHIVLGNINNAQLYIDSAKNICPNKLHLENIDLIRSQIELLLKQGKSLDAEKLLDEFTIQAKTLRNDSLTINFLLLNANMLSIEGNHKKALETIDEALALSQGGTLNSKESECYRLKGSIQLRKGEYNSALASYQHALSRFVSLNDTANTLITLRNISLAYRDMGKYTESLEALNSSLKIALQGNRHNELGRIYNLLGSLYARMGKNNEALENYSHSLAIREKHQYLSSYASTLENISRIQRKLEQYPEALSNLQKTITIRKELNDKRLLASTYNEIGTLYAQQGMLADALKNYLNSLKIRQEENLVTDMSRSLINIGVTYRQLKSHQNALKYFNQALSITSDDADPIGKSYIYIHLGNTYMDINNPTEAIKSYKEALAYRKKIGNERLISQAMRSLAVAYAENNQFAKANSLLHNALAIAQQKNDTKSQADIYNELGNLSLKEDKLRQAIDYFEKASVIYEDNSNLDRRGLCIRKIGETQIKLKEYTKAINSLNLALKLAKATENIKLKELTLLALYEYYDQIGQPTEALSYYKMHVATRDILNKQVQEEAIWQASLDLELNKKAEEIKQIESEVESLRTEAQLKTLQLEQQALLRNFLIVISIFILIIAIGSVYGYVTIRRKNTTLYEANEKLAQSEGELKKLVQTKDKLFSIIAHDLRSPFTALVGLTEVLTNDSGRMNQEERNEFSGVIHSSSTKLLSLIDNLLHWSRSQTGKIKLNPQRANLYNLTTEVISVLELQATPKSIDIKNEIPESIHINADYNTMSTVMRNLISNAIKFTETNGKVVITASQSSKGTKLSVADSGIGISPENQEKLFKIEHSYSTEGTSNEKGTGLGLIVCKEFVEQNNGNITVTSELNVGTTFNITFPTQLNE
ncbi:MAG: tetratricopeptide repeat protein [Tenuifilaceae bacterium]|nr:tetratricopeptide repeat protein [Tenuifilaceae bacterium]